MAGDQPGRDGGGRPFGEASAQRPMRLGKAAATGDGLAFVAYEMMRKA